MQIKSWQIALASMILLLINAAILLLTSGVALLYLLIVGIGLFFLLLGVTIASTLLLKSDIPKRNATGEALSVSSGVMILFVFSPGILLILDNPLDPIYLALGLGMNVVGILLLLAGIYHFWKKI